MIKKIKSEIERIEGLLGLKMANKTKDELESRKLCYQHCLKWAEETEAYLEDLFLSSAIHNQSDAGDYWIIKKKDWNNIKREVFYEEQLTLSTSEVKGK